MQVINIPLVSVLTTTTALVTAQQLADAGPGLAAIVVNPSVDIVIVDTGTSGTVAASPFVCAASVPTTIPHRGGILRAISTSGTASVKVGLWCNP